MRIRLALAAAVLGVTLGGAALACSKPKDAAAIEASLADWINGERAKKGLPRLSVNADLGAAAAKHACKMAADAKLSHAGFPSRLRGAGFGSGVENVARSTESSASAPVRIWKGSSKHWENILNSGARSMGLGTATAGGRTYYVFMAGSR
ncbi:CAP domain-containing protein [Xinfangfangia pollutisoli]|uniref:CAP domain-containing protein n=1 Tax=Xinfangfangia pollutisoli TaxID=2865960 RepID=UPI001CD5DEF1|nr:CAP domain-containing protein [Xinfangfangia pollutisoli]